MTASSPPSLSQEIFSLWNQLCELEQLQRVEYARLGHSPALLSIPVSGPDRVVKLQEITLIEAEGRRSRVHLRNGESILSNTGFPLIRAAKALAAWPQFQRLHENTIVNLNQVQTVGSHPLQVRDYQLCLAAGQTVTITESRAPMLMRWFGLESLRKVEPFHHKWGAAFYLENLRPFPKELRLMTPDELHHYFDHPQTKRFQTQEFIANFIWEYYHLMQRGQRPPVEGNIRTFWYVLKPTLSKAIPLQSEKHYAIMLNVFQRMVTRYGLFKFKDFDFTDEGEQFYQLGDQHPQIILVAEKTGHYKRLQALQKEFGISIIGLGGMPSLLTTEYFATALRQATKPKAQTGFHIISITDFDPSGAIILKSFITQLKFEGVKHLASVQPLLVPSHFTADEITSITEPVPLKTKADQTKAQRWLAAGGGVDGKPLGIESEALILDAPRFRGVFLDAFNQALTATPAEVKASDYQPLQIETTENLLLLHG